jgi:hypothetical protein
MRDTGNDEGMTSEDCELSPEVHSGNSLVVVGFKREAFSDVGPSLE